MSEYEVRTKYLIMPADTNDMYPLVFGGALYGQMDICAALVTRQFLRGTGCSRAVTHKSNVTFFLPSYSGDVLDIIGDVVSAHNKSIVIKVTAWRGLDKIAEVEHVFVSIETLKSLEARPMLLPYANHGKPYKPE